MNIQYISDSDGNKTAVVIPIQEWEVITEKRQDLKPAEKPNDSEKKLKPSDFAGKMSEKGYYAMKKHIKKARAEWDRDF